MMAWHPPKQVCFNLKKLTDIIKKYVNTFWKTDVTKCPYLHSLSQEIFTFSWIQCRINPQTWSFYSLTICLANQLGNCLWDVKPGRPSSCRRKWRKLRELGRNLSSGLEAWPHDLDVTLRLPLKMSVPCTGVPKFNSWLLLLTPAFC